MEKGDGISEEGKQTYRLIGDQGELHLLSHLHESGKQVGQEGLGHATSCKVRSKEETHRNKWSWSYEEWQVSKGETDYNTPIYYKEVKI